MSILTSATIERLINLFGLIFSVNIEDVESKRRKQRKHEQQRADGNRPAGVKRATDDYHYDKFKKQFRRY